jgi:trimethylamine--corrinoid protein Co-methyltransferase
MHSSFFFRREEKERMMVKIDKVLSEGDQKKIFDKAISLLVKTGFLTNHGECLELFDQAGCKIGKEVEKPKGGRIVEFTEEIITDALGKMPGAFTLYPMHPGYEEVNLMNGGPYFSTAGGDFVWDLNKEELRLGTQQDLVMGTRLADSCDNYQAQEWPIMWCYDTFPEDDYNRFSAYGLTLGIMMLHTGKPLLPVWWSASETEVPDYIKLYQIAAGGAEAFKEKPNGGIVIAALSPLALCGRVEKDDPWGHADSVVPMAEAGVPAFIEPCGLMGLTAPVTVAGLLTLDVAEFMAINVLYQTANPGHPVLINDMTGSTDMMTGTKAQARPEHTLHKLGLVDMARYLGVPIWNFMTSASNVIDVQCGWETMANTLTAYLYDTDLIGHVTALSAEDVYDPRSVVIGNEIIDWVKFFAKGISMEEEDIPLEEMISHGPMDIYGDFLSSKHTRKYYKTKMQQPSKVVNRLSRDAWLKEGKPDIRDKASAMAKEILEKYEPRISEERQKRIRDYIEEILDRENIVGDDAKEIMDKTYWQGM